MVVVSGEGMVSYRLWVLLLARGLTLCTLLHLDSLVGLGLGLVDPIPAGDGSDPEVGVILITMNSYLLAS